METTYRVEELAGKGPAISLPSDLAGSRNLPQQMVVAFGCERAFTRVAVGAGQGPDRLGLTAELVSALRLPPDLTCRVRLRGGPGSGLVPAGAAPAQTPGLLLGPCVGLLGARRHDELTAGRLFALSNHLLAAPAQGGLFVAFDRESIDLQARAVTGYRWLGDRWEDGRFPLPNVIFRRFGVGLDEKLGPLRALGLQVFNERTFHKGEAARWLAADPAAAPHTPETTDLQGPASVAAMLERHPTVFIKPVWGSLADGIIRVRRDGAGCVVEPAGEAAPVACPDRGAGLAATLRGRLPGHGLVQQGIDLAPVGGRMLDFRVVVQKDGTGRWQVPGAVARVGEAALFVSNMATGGFPMAVEEGLALLFGPDPAVLFRRRQQLADVALTAARALEQGGLHLGDLGLDIAYDVHHHPWIIEANNRDPDHNIGWEAGDWPLFYQFRSLPAAYALHLAGFGRDQ